MLWGPRHRGVMAQRAGALCGIEAADNRLVGGTVIDPAGVDGGDLTVGNGVGWFRGTEAWSSRSTRERTGRPADRTRRGQWQRRCRLRAAVDLGS